MDRAQALGAELVAGDGHRREVLQLARLGVLDGVGHQMHLDVGRGELRPRAQEGEQGRRRQAHEAAAGGDVLQELGRGTQPARHVVVGDLGVFHLPDDAGVDMVAEILADRRQLVLHLDAVLLQDLRPADARQLEDLRRRDAARRQDDFRGARLHDLAVLLVLDADAALALKQHAQRMGVGHDFEVGRTFHRRFGREQRVEGAGGYHLRTARQIRRLRI